MGKASRQSFHARKKPGTGRLQIPAQPSPPPAVIKQVDLEPRRKAGHGKQRSLSLPTPESSQAILTAEDDSEQAMTVEQAIKMGWSFVNRRFEDNTEEEEDPTLQEFITLLRAVDNNKAAKERHHNQELLVATIASLTESIASMRSEVSDMKSDVVTFATMEQRQSVLDGRIIDMQSDMVKFTTMIQRQLNDKFSEVQNQLGEATHPCIISVIKLAEVQEQMVTSASFEKACSSIEDIVTAVEERLAGRLDTVTVKTAGLAKQLEAVANVGNTLSERQKQLQAAANVGNKLAGCITNELRDVQGKADKLPKMASLLETVKFCVRLIAKRLNVPEVEAALPSRSPQVQHGLGPVTPIQHAPTNAAGRTAVQPQASAAAPYMLPPGAKAAQAKQAKSMSVKQKTARSTRLPYYGRMDQYVFKTGQASK